MFKQTRAETVAGNVCMKLRSPCHLEKFERLTFIQEVTRSIRVSSTNKIKHYLGVGQHRTSALSENLSELSRVVRDRFFELVPSDADAIVMKSVIHDWNDQRRVRILRNCHRVLRRQARLMVIDRIVPEKLEPRWTIRRLC